MSWDADFSKYRKIWGERPSELALVAAKRLIRHKGRPLRVLDIGCGYGRDTIYIAKTLGFRVLGIDVSEKAIELARENASEAMARLAEFKVMDFRDLHSYFDVVFASNLYHLLTPDLRRDLATHASRLLFPNGKLFLNAISIKDKEHYGVGKPILDEENAWLEGKYIHLSTEQELRDGFTGLNILELYEHEYEELHLEARTHNHIAWILVAEKYN